MTTEQRWGLVFFFAVLGAMGAARSRLGLGTVPGELAFWGACVVAVFAWAKAGWHRDPLGFLLIAALTTSLFNTRYQLGGETLSLISQILFLIWVVAGITVHMQRAWRRAEDTTPRPPQNGGAARPEQSWLLVFLVATLGAWGVAEFAPRTAAGEWTFWGVQLFVAFALAKAGGHRSLLGFLLMTIVFTWLFDSRYHQLFGEALYLVNRGLFLACLLAATAQVLRTSHAGSQ